MKRNQNEQRVKQVPTSRRLLELSLLSVLIAAASAGCKPEEKAVAESKSVAAAPGEINPVGLYALASVDGQQVPCSLTHEGHPMTINSGSFMINADGTCGSKISLAGREAALEVAAHYTREGSKLTMQWAGAGVTVGTVDGRTFTMNNEGMVFVYRR